LKNSFQRLNIFVAFALMVFTVTGLTQLGLMLQVVELLTRYKFLPLGATYGAYMTIFAASGTRDPRYYHPVEWFAVSGVLVFMTLHAFLAEVQNLVASYDPWASAVIMVFMVVAGAILAR